MIRTLWKTAATGRVGMVAAVVVLTLLGRLSAVFMPDAQWAGSERQDLYGAVILWLVLPVFTAMLGSALLRGEHAPWSWGMARPVARARLLGAMVAIDVVTIVACVGVGAVIFGGFGAAWEPFGTYGGTGVALACYLALYLAAATAGAWTSSSVRAVVAGGGVLGGTIVALGYAVQELSPTHVLGLVHRDWAVLYVADSMPEGLRGLPPLGPLALGLFGCVAAALTIPVGLGVGFLRAASFVPARPPLAIVLRPGAVCIALVLASIAATGTALLLTAPPEARRGDTTVELSLVGPPPEGEYVLYFDLCYATDLLTRPLSKLRTYSRPVRDAAWQATEVSAGNYRLCATFGSDSDPMFRREMCMPVTVDDAPFQQIGFDLSLASPGNVPVGH